MEHFTSDDVEKNKEMAAFSYIWIFSIILFVTRKDSPFIRFHARQGIVLTLLSVPTWYVPIIGLPFSLLLVAGMMMGFLNALLGRSDDVPFIGKLSRGEVTLSDCRTALQRATSAIKDYIKHFTQRRRAEVRGQPPRL